MLWRVDRSLFSSARMPCFAAFLRLNLSTKYSGAATTGKMMEKQPNPQRQLMWLIKSSAALGPANAVIMKGEEVKAYARPRFFSLDASAVMTSTQYVMPLKPSL